MLSRILVQVINPDPGKTLPVWLAALLVIACMAIVGNVEAMS